MPLTETRRKLAALQSFDVVSTVTAILNENADLIVGLIRGQLGSKGKTGLGEPTKARLGAFYQFATIRHKKLESGLGGVIDFVTMYDSGAFYASLNLKVEGQVFNVESNVPYFEKINAWNDGVLIDMDKDNLELLSQQIVVPQLKEIFNTQVIGV